MVSAAPSEPRWAQVSTPAAHHYTVDFYCPELGLAVELDGGVHSPPRQLKSDKEKDEYLRALGLQVVRIPNGWVLEDPEGFVRRIAGSTPHPSVRRRTPSPARGEGQTPDYLW